MPVYAGRVDSGEDMINQSDSALGKAVVEQIETGAGPERAVAATKSFVLTLTALVHLVATMVRNLELQDALGKLPTVLEQCKGVDWSAATDVLKDHDDVFVVGRGPDLPIARELALKFKEVCGIHAEALSAAELLHGPIAISTDSGRETSDGVGNKDGSTTEAGEDDTKRLNAYRMKGIKECLTKRLKRR